jgi:hypothetical protein
MTTTCAACATELPDNAKFCLECGAPAATAAKPAEYKQVTVLFADVVHSMDIAAAVGAERLSLAKVPIEPNFAVYEIHLLRMRALLARAEGDEARYRELADRYRAMAAKCEYEGHMKLAEAMT